MMDKEMLERVHTAICCTWEMIAHDWMTATRVDEMNITLFSVIEGCLSADRVTNFGDDEEAARALYAIGSWKEMSAIAEDALKSYGYE